MPDDFMDATEQVDFESPETTDTDLERSEPETDAAPSPYDLNDVPEEHRALVEAKLQEKQKALEAGYTPKFQTLAEERRAFEAERQSFEASRTTQQPAAEQTQYVDPLADADWENGWTQDGRPISQVMKEQDDLRWNNLVNYLQQRDSRLTEIDGHFTQQQKTEQLNELKAEYGEFDLGELEAAQKAAPGVPLKYVAALLLQGKKVQSGVDKALGNREVKRQATPLGSSSAKTTPNVDTKGWDMHKFADFTARNPGVRL